MSQQILLAQHLFKLTCPSGKVVLQSKSKAKHFASTKQREHGRRFKIYRCKLCDYWHLATFDPPKKEMNARISAAGDVLRVMRQSAKLAYIESGRRDAEERIMTAVMRGEVLFLPYGPLDDKPVQILGAFRGNYSPLTGTDVWFKWLEAPDTVNYSHAVNFDVLSMGES